MVNCARESQYPYRFFAAASERRIIICKGLKPKDDNEFPSRNRQIWLRSRCRENSTAGIGLIFRGLNVALNADISQIGHLWMGTNEIAKETALITAYRREVVMCLAPIFLRQGSFCAQRALQAAKRSVGHIIFRHALHNLARKTTFGEMHVS